MNFCLFLVITNMQNKNISNNDPRLLKLLNSSLKSQLFLADIHEIKWRVNEKSHLYLRDISPL